MKLPSKFTLAFIAVMIGYAVLYFAYVTIFPKYPFEADLPTYSAALMQGEHPELYSRDPVYSDGALTARFWASSSLYMRIFQFLHNVTQQNISATLALLQFIPAFLFCLTFYWFLQVFRLDRWLTLMVSVALSIWLILRVYEGIASVYYFVFIPIFLRLIWQGLCEPSLDNQPIPVWRVALIGAVIGISPLINSVTGLAFNLLILSLLTIQFLAWKMRWTSYAAYLVGLAPCLGVAVLSGAGGATMQDIAAGQHLVDRMSTGSLIALIVGPANEILSVVFTPSQSWLFYIPLAGVLVSLSLWLRFASQTARGIKMVFVFLSGVFWLWMLGDVGLILTMYLLSRFAMKRETRLDIILITALNVAIFNGTALIWIALGLWSVLKMPTIALILSEMFRFHYQAFFLISVGLLFMVHHLTENVKDISTKRLIQLMLISMVVIQSYQQVKFSLGFLVFLATVLILIGLSFSSKYYFTRPIRRPKSWRGALRLTVLMGAIAILSLGAMFRLTWPDLWSSSTPLTLETLIHLSQQYQSREDVIRADYLDMTAWLRNNTPPDSLIYFEQTSLDRSGFFRYLTQRALVFTWMDESVGQYSPGLAASSRQLAAEVNALTPDTFPSLLERYDVNYLVIPSQQSILLPGQKPGEMLPATLVYENASYKIYSIALS